MEEKVAILSEQNYSLEVLFCEDFVSVDLLISLLFISEGTFGAEPFCCTFVVYKS